jgi:hypothetical protein
MSQPTDPTDVYTRAKNEFEAAEQAAQRFAERALEQATVLQDWKHVVAASSVQDFGRLAASPNAAVFDKSDWPAGDQIEAALVRWHKALRGFHEAYDRLPPERQKVVPPPPAPPT